MKVPAFYLGEKSLGATSRAPDTMAREALERPVASVARHLDPGRARTIAAEGLEFAESRPLGGTWVLDALWERLGSGWAFTSP